jgi:ribosomal protein S18 acetylase RimI-like enzyme
VEIKIRPAHYKESALLTDLAMRAKARWGYPKEWLTLWTEQLTVTSEYIQRHSVLIAEHLDAVVGMCALEERGDYWQLEHVWIDPAFQRQGIGRQLVTCALDLARARPGPVRLVADPYAREFYLGLGAREVGSVPAPMDGAPERTLPVMEFL